MLLLVGFGSYMWINLKDNSDGDSIAILNETLVRLDNVELGSCRLNLECDVASSLIIGVCHCNCGLVETRFRIHIKLEVKVFWIKVHYTSKS